ncbi:imidazole glycerol phosphate synthase subunit HisH [bacterium]|nr:imidazole glycerol phosphate synthase subunit HisH [bacterium]MBU3955277.1 imidazole glycerol phosphate synthase subunit HisH [bacterium]
MAIKPSITVIDYGLGNVKSVSKALELAGGSVRVSSEIKKIESSDGIVIPGVGAFGKGMNNLKKANLVKIIKSQIASGKPCLGICLGLQMLFTKSSEHGEAKGMDIIKGNVKLFGNNLKIPHMGWNRIRFQKQKTELFEGIADGSYFYFVHSYYVTPEDSSIVSSTTNYGDSFTSSIVKNNLWAMQFHPEKSGNNGLQIMKNFIRKCGGRQ